MSVGALPTAAGYIGGSLLPMLKQAPLIHLLTIIQADFCTDMQ
jgi:hypothetical protein